MNPHAAIYFGTFYPLVEFYQRMGVPQPLMEPVAVADIPPTARELLVHDDDMTPRLESFYRQTIHLRVLMSIVQSDILSRMVVLVLDDAGKAVEFGAIQIHLDLFEERTRAGLLEGYKPFGSILYEYAIPHESHPTSYFQVRADRPMMEALGIDRSEYLYGRCNVMTAPSGERMAEVVEIVPAESVILL